jgi:TonB family protein
MLRVVPGGNKSFRDAVEVKGTLNSKTMLKNTTSFLVLLCGVILTANAADRPLQDQLADQYVGQTVFLRHAFTSDSQEFDSDGKPMGKVQEGPWTFYGRLVIKKIAVDDDRLLLEGNRVVYKFDQDAEHLVSVPESQSVQITIRLRSPLTSMDEAVSVLGRVLALTDKEIQNAIPPVWRPYLAKSPGTDETKDAPSQDAGNTGSGAPGQENRVFQLGEPKLSAPKPQFTPSPAFEAKPGFSGVVSLNTVVDSQGRVTKVKVVRSLGKGLDEEAIRAVKTWRFTPAMRDGNPVAVSLMIEIDFRAYNSR